MSMGTCASPARTVPRHGAGTKPAGADQEQTWSSPEPGLFPGMGLVCVTEQEPQGPERFLSHARLTGELRVPLAQRHTSLFSGAEEPRLHVGL